MIVQLSVDISDEQRRALTGSRRLASRDEVRAFVAGAVARLSEPLPSDRSTSPAPLVGRAAAPAPKTSPDLQQRLAKLKEEGWTEDQLRSFERGWRQI